MLKEAVTAFVGILYPKSCHVCSKILKDRTSAFDEHLCWSCFSSMKPAPPVLPQDMCGEAAPCQALHACYLYEDATRELVHKFKYGHRPYLAGTVAKLMTRLLRPALFREVDGLVPVPLHPARLREREFNQAELMAMALGPLLEKPVWPVLKRVRNTKSQTAVKKTQRFSNCEGAFAATRGVCIKDKHALIIDDVVTTAATVTEAARLLRQAGARKVSVLAFARG